MKPKIILCDIDGTIADCSHRRHWVSPEINVGDTVKVKHTPHKLMVVGCFNNNGTYQYRLEPNEIGQTYYDETKHKKVKRWDKFFAEVSGDAPIRTTIDALWLFYDSYYRIVFVSARPEKTRRATKRWMVEHLGYQLGGSALYMRPDEDQREDSIVKREIYDRDIAPFYDVQLVLDDRDKVVAMWRSLGLTCWQVAEGKF